ncbi:pyroglutamyl-peptidase I family protein, partial [Pseudomonas lundensis]
MRTVLLTGFEPFDQDTLNPSWEAVKALDQRLIKEDTRIVSRQLPCVFSQAPARLRELLETVRPDLVIAVG